MALDEKEHIKDAFQKAKKDIFFLQNQILDLKREIEKLKRTSEYTENAPFQQTDNSKNTTDSQHIFSKSEDQDSISGYKSLKTPNNEFSTGNRGVPTDRQTNQQTDKPTQKFGYYGEIGPSIKKDYPSKKLIQSLTSYQELKNEILEKFRSLTSQELLVYSAIYQYQLEEKQIDYSLLSKSLNLTESSIRDYILKIIKKGVPLIKNKQNNKKIYLEIPSEIISSLSLDSLSKLKEYSKISLSKI